MSKPTASVYFPNDMSSRTICHGIHFPVTDITVSEHRNYSKATKGSNAHSDLPLR